MDLHLPADPLDPDAQRAADRRRLQRAVNVALAAVLLLLGVHAAQGGFDVRPFTVQPWRTEGLVGLLTAPLLHGSWAHVGANSIALLMLGALVGTSAPRAGLHALPLLWLGSGMGAWLLGAPGTFHLGASGVTHGLMFLLLTLGLLRRDRAAVAAAMIAFLFYGGMLLTVLPREAGVSWQAHLGGALGGIVAGLLFRTSDPLPPRKRYSWEDEAEAEQAPAREDADTFEPPRPPAVPVLWQRPEDTRGTVLPFTPRPRQDDSHR